MDYRKSLSLLGLALIAWPSAIVWAQPDCEMPANPAAEALVTLALQCNGGQRAMAARVESLEHRVAVAGSLDDPTLALGAAPRSFAADDLDRGYIVELNQSLPWPGTLPLREAAASARARAYAFEREEDQVRLAREVRLALARWYRDHELLAINSRYQQLWEEFIAVVEAKYAAGIGSKSAVLQATHEHHLLLEEAIQLDAQTGRDASELARLLNVPVNNDTPPPLNNQSLPAVTPALLVRLVDSFEQQPGVKRLQARQQQTDRELALAQKDRYPDLALTSRYNSLWQREELRWFVGVGINLPFDFGKRRGAESSLEAERLALQWEEQDLLVELREQVHQAHSHWREARDINRLYRDELIPLAEENLITARDDYQSGSGDFLSLLTAERQTLLTERKAVQATVNEFIRFAQLTAAAGFVLTDDWRTLATTPAGVQP